jgi:putative alpha-1,2-mannosidase
MLKLPLMLKLLVSLLVVATTVANGVTVASKRPTSCAQYDLVNPFIGTGGFGYGYGGLNPAAQLPHGPLRLGPDTMTTTIDLHFQHFSGYYYVDNIVRAFSHTHSVGAGVNDWGSVGVMPIRLQENGHLPSLELPTPAGDFRSRFWWSEFNKTTEYASPGVYGIHLDKPDVSVELLAIGTHAGIHKYVWKADPSKSAILPGLVLDMCHYSTLSANVINDSRCPQANIKIDESGEFFSGSTYITGSLTHGLWVHVYGELKSNRPTKAEGNVGKEWRVCDGLVADCTQSYSGEGTDGILYALGLLGATHSQTDFELQVAVGISFIDVEHAKGNLYHSLQAHGKQTNGLANYNSLKSSTRATWCDVIGTMDVTAQQDDEEMAPMLYSALYRSHMSPTTYVEYDGQYFATDKQAHNVTAERLSLYGDHLSESPQSYQFYSDLSFWDTFRTAHPWLLLTDEDLAIGIARCFNILLFLCKF